MVHDGMRSARQGHGERDPEPWLSLDHAEQIGQRGRLPPSPERVIAPCLERGDQSAAGLDVSLERARLRVGQTRGVAQDHRGIAAQLPRVRDVVVGDDLDGQVQLERGLEEAEHGLDVCVRDLVALRVGVPGQRVF